jgi:uncharacterized membrane protein
MGVLIAGLVLFLGIHSVRIVADDWRTARIAAWGPGRWKGLYSLASIVGLVLVVWGYGLARQHPVVLWNPPAWTRPVAGVLVLLAFVLLAAGRVPGNSIKARVHHPMVLGVKTWAFAHLLANGTLADVVLFGPFLLWAIFSFRAARRRDAAAGTAYPDGTPGRTFAAVAAGVVAWAVFAFYLHARLIGMQPLP